MRKQNKQPLIWNHLYRDLSLLDTPIVSNCAHMTQQNKQPPTWNYLNYVLSALDTPVISNCAQITEHIKLMIYVFQTHKLLVIVMK